MQKISVIVPIYNVELYLERCIESIVNQTYTNLEIILINDGSKDKSLDICNKYKDIDKRIIVVDKDNGGVSSARNKGLEIASGDYITFVDPDDWIELNMYESMYKDINENNCDVIMCNYIIENEKDSIKINLNLDNNIYTNEMITENIISNMISAPSINGNDCEIMGSVWRLLIKRSIVKENHILFNENISIAEDLVFCIELFLKTKKVYVQKNYNYHYFQRKGSALNSYKENMRCDSELLYNTIVNIVNKNNLKEKMKKRLCIAKYSTFYHIIENSLKRGGDESFLQVIKIIKEFCNDTSIQYLLDNQNIKECKFSRAVYIILLKKKMYFLVYLYHKVLNIYVRIRNI